MLYVSSSLRTYWHWSVVTTRWVLIILGLVLWSVVQIFPIEYSSVPIHILRLSSFNLPTALHAHIHCALQLMVFSNCEIIYITVLFGKLLGKLTSYVHWVSLIVTLLASPPTLQLEIYVSPLWTHPINIQTILFMELSPLTQNSASSEATYYRLYSQYMHTYICAGHT